VPMLSQCCVVLQIDSGHELGAGGEEGLIVSEETDTEHMEVFVSGVERAPPRIP
jgi:hypothetical protein